MTLASAAMDKHVAHTRLIEASARCLKYAMRTLEIHAAPLLPGIMSQISSIFKV